MLRFTLRDLFWLTIIVALATAWTINRADLISRMRATKRHAMVLRDALWDTEQNQYVVGQAESRPVDWELAGRMIP